MPPTQLVPASSATQTTLSSIHSTATAAPRSDLPATPPGSPKISSSSSPVSSLLQATALSPHSKAQRHRRSSVASQTPAWEMSIAADAAGGEGKRRGPREEGRASLEVTLDAEGPVFEPSPPLRLHKSRSASERMGVATPKQRRPGKGGFEDLGGGGEKDWCLVNGILGCVSSDSAICGVKLVDHDLLILKPRTLDFSPPLHQLHLPFLRMPVLALSTSLSTATGSASKIKEEVVERAIEIGIDDGTWRRASGQARFKAGAMDDIMALRVYEKANSLQQIYPLPASSFRLHRDTFLFRSSSNSSTSTSTSHPATFMAENSETHIPLVQLDFDRYEYCLFKPKSRVDLERLYSLVADEDEYSEKQFEEEMVRRKCAYGIAALSFVPSPAGLVSCSSFFDFDLPCLCFLRPLAAPHSHDTPTPSPVPSLSTSSSRASSAPSTARKPPPAFSRGPAPSRRFTHSIPPPLNLNPEPPARSPLSRSVPSTFPSPRSAATTLTSGAYHYAPSSAGGQTVTPTSPEFRRDCSLPSPTLEKERVQALHPLHKAKSSIELARQDMLRIDAAATGARTREGGKRERGGGGGCEELKRAPKGWGERGKKDEAEEDERANPVMSEEKDAGEKKKTSKKKRELRRFASVGAI
ncbi:hypothetical protein JCM11641_002745 [Rhodosporidiobolus odoratus]